MVLPVKALLEQYKSNDSVIIKQLDLSFIQHSLDRVDDDNRRDLIPIALRGCSGDEGQSRAGPFFQIILRLLLDVRVPPRGSKDDEGFRESVGLSDPSDAKYVANLIGLFLRLRPPTPAQTWDQANPTFAQHDLCLFSVENAGSQKIFERVSELKAKLVTLLASGAFTDEEKFLPALFAASSFDNRVASTAEEIIKRSTVSMENESLVRRLFDAHSTLQAAYRTRILGTLCKSSVSTTMPSRIMDVVNLDFMPEDSGSVSRQAQQPSSTLERTRLHKALFQYLSWVARIGPSKDDFTIAPQLIQSMRSYIETQGWPVSERNSADDIALRSKAYETIGMLSRSADMPIQERLDLAAWLFRSLSEDPINDTVVNIDGALSSLTANIPPNIGSEEKFLKSMLLTYMSLPDEAPAVRSTRHAVVKWANQCLPFSSIYGRWIDILAVGGSQNERNDVTEQGHKGLDPWTYCAHNEANPTLPDWKEMVVMFFGSLITPEAVDAPDSMEDLTGSHSKLVFRNFSGNRIAAFPVALRYIKRMMFLSALDDLKVEPDWMQTLDAYVKSDVASRDKIRAYLRPIDSGYWVFYLKACLDGALLEDSPITEECLRCFVDVASLCPGGALGYLAKLSNELLGLIKSNNKEVRSLSAKAFGILAAHPVHEDDVVENWRKTLESLFDGAEKAFGADLNAAEGALLAFAHHCSRSVFYNHAVPADLNPPFRFLVGENVSSSLLETAFESFSQLWTAGLAIPPLEGGYSRSKVVEKLTAHTKKGNEKAILALGRLAVGLNDPPSTDEPTTGSELLSQGVLGTILKELFALHEIKRVEVHFTVGDAISAAAARWDSDYVKLTMDVEPRNTQLQVGSRKALTTAILDKLFTDCKATKPSLLKASGIWLFCIVQYCSHLLEVQTRLREAQAAFMRLLSARDELVQETASRGLSLVYERGDTDLKSTLVKDLVSAFTGSGTQLKVDEDTELFEPGALPTGEGNSITSYKDIVNLANEVGDQRLVYKFMSLAANAATWSTRSAFGRFGLSNILSDSEVDPKLYPKLYRYRFDPNTNVQRSMEDIWKALVKDSGSVLDAYFDDILDDLLKSILGREWRMREASCAAISELLQGRPFPQYEKRYREVWTTALKVLDDVKGSVREAALRLCMALSNSLVRQLDESNDSSAAKAMMGEALPFLLSDKGVESSVKDVQVFATLTVMKIAKQGGNALKPFIPDMVPQLLGLLSTIEPEQINYHYQRAGEDSRDQIDKLRSQMVNRSPISEAIENCLRFIDEDVMAKLAPKLEATAKSAIGMPTKIGCSRVLTTLFTRHTSDIKPFSSKFLKMMEKQAMDKNDEVSQAYARACAYIMRVVSDTDKVRFCERLVKMYIESEEESRRQKISDIVVALAKISSDHFTANETELLPFAYLGAHDTDEYTQKVFKEVWDQHAGSNRTVVRYVPEIVALVERCLDTNQWALRHTGAFTVGAMVSDVAAASEATGEISESNLKTLWPVFDKTLALKTFSGKQKLLESYPQFVEKGASLWKGNSQISAQMKKIAIREAKRNNDEYRVHAFKCLWRFAKARDDLDMLQEIADIVTPHMDEFNDEDKMEIDTKEDLAMKSAKNGLEAIARGYNRSKLKSESGVVLAKIITILQPYLSSTKFGAIKREVWYDAVYDLMKPFLEPSSSVSETGQRSQPLWAEKDDGVSLQYLRSLDVEQFEAGAEAQRTRRAEAVKMVVQARLTGAFGVNGPDLGGFEKDVLQAVERERALKPQQAMKAAAKTIRRVAE